MDSMPVYNILRIIPKTWLPKDAAILHCSETFMLAFIVTPIFFLHGFTWNSSVGVRKLQVAILARSSREMSQTVRID